MVAIIANCRIGFKMINAKCIRWFYPNIDWDVSHEGLLYACYHHVELYNYLYTKLSFKIVNFAIL